MKKSLFFIVALSLLGSSTLIAQCYGIVNLDTSATSNGDSTFTINTANSNELILISYNGFTWDSVGGKGPVTVDGDTAVKVNVAHVPNSGTTEVFSYMAAKAGTHRIKCTEKGFIYPPYGINFAVAFYASNSCKPLTDTNLISTARIIVPYTGGSVSDSIITSFPNSMIFCSAEINEGETSSYSISWTHATFLDDLHEGDGIDASDAYSFAAAPGNYKIIAHNKSPKNNGTGGLALVLVAIRPPLCGLAATVSASSDATCSGSSNGSISVTVTGGNPPFTYLWNNRDTTTTITGLSAGTYSVFITDSNGCSYLLRDTISVFPAPPAPNICYVTVDSNSQYDVVVWQKTGMDTNAIDSVLILRQISLGKYSRVGEVSVHGHTEFTDLSSQPKVLSYYYTLGLLTDSCGNGDTSSNLNKTIHLQTSIGFANSIDLIWNDYLGQTVNYYRILKDSLGNGNWRVLDSVPFGITSYTDFNPGNSINLAYMINAVLNVNCTPSLVRPPHIHKATKFILKTADESYSNIGVINYNGIENQSSVGYLQLSVYPNPAKDELFITFPQPIEAQLYLTDMLGRDVYFGQISGNNKTEVVNIAHFTEGVYMLTIEAGGMKVVKKVIKF